MTKTFFQHFHVSALASYPGSGNTWVRYLIESVTGVMTSDERDSVEDGVVTGAEILIKSHHRRFYFYLRPETKDSLNWRLNDISFFNGEGILIIRNPFDSIRLAIKVHKILSLK